MGYTTSFDGNTRRMRRNSDVVAARPDPVRLAVGLPVGIDGGFFVGADGPFGQEHSADLIDFNLEPSDQPGLYAYAEWLKYLIDKFLTPWGYQLNGTVMWQGERDSDVGKIICADNVVTVKRGRIVFD